VSGNCTCVCIRQVGVYVFYVAVVPHITDAIQEWVERVANQPVTEDGSKPQVGGD
jgi:CTP synthase (UTP-ammonia lyase)